MAVESLVSLLVITTIFSFRVKKRKKDRTSSSCGASTTFVLAGKLLHSYLGPKINFKKMIVLGLIPSLA